MLFSDKFVSLEINLSCGFARTANFSSIQFLCFFTMVSYMYILIICCSTLPIATSWLIVKQLPQFTPLAPHSSLINYCSLVPFPSLLPLLAFPTLVVNLQYDVSEYPHRDLALSGAKRNRNSEIFWNFRCGKNLIRGYLRISDQYHILLIF